MNSVHNIREPLIELNNMIGMNELKNSIVDQILYFIQELHKNKNFSGDFLHTVIYGPPGTGKTEIAKIMGKIYSKRYQNQYNSKMYHFHIHHQIVKYSQI